MLKLSEERESFLWFANQILDLKQDKVNMAVPKRKTSPSRRGNRRSHNALVKPNLSATKDSFVGLAHRAIQTDEGLFYKGELIIKKKEKKQKEESAN